MRRILLTVSLTALVAGALYAMAAPAGAQGTTCSGTGVSFDSDGKRQDEASRGPNQGGTKDNPFDVWADGTVDYTYAIPQQSGEGSWDLKIQKTPISFGNEINEDSSPEGDGKEQLEDHFKPGGVTAIIGLYKVDIKVDRGGEECTVSGWIKVHGSLLTAPIFWVGLILTALGALLGFLAVTGGGGAVRSVLAGLLLGVGIAVLLIVFGVIALGTLTPYIVIVVGLVLGVAWSALSGRLGGGTATPAV